MFNDYTEVFDQLLSNNEIWKPVVGYEGWYEVSNLARVRRIRKSTRFAIGHILKPGTNKGGYKHVVLVKDGKEKTFGIHRLVAFAFLGQPPTPKHQVNHKNSNPSDNNLENLEWVTPSENQQHSYDHGFHRPLKGENAGHVKLTLEQVREIRKLHASGHMQKDLAVQFSVTSTAIWQIVHFENWKEA